MDTIFARATALGKAGVAVIRISGPDAIAGCERIAGHLPPPGRSGVRTLRAEDGSMLDSALVLTFAAGASFTGEETVEFQTHGSVAVIRVVLDTLTAIPGFRPAEAGEFTRCALDNDRMDLAQVEGLADLIDAETELQREQALAVSTGELSRQVESWRTRLIDAAALIEATIDFADEEVPVDVKPDVATLLDSVLSEIRQEIGSAKTAERIRDGFEVAILGAPNAGKSTLLNAIARRQVALTSDIAGTTRDVIELRVDLHGLPVTFLDTAGLRQSTDVLESAGIDLAKNRAEKADLRVYLQDGDEPPNGIACEIVVSAKSDLSGTDGVSGLTGAGIEALTRNIAEHLSARIPAQRLAVRERHRIVLEGAVSSLEDAMNGIIAGDDEDIVAENIRLGLNALGEMIGRVDVEDLLDQIFSRFCIGK